MVLLFYTTARPCLPHRLLDLDRPEIVVYTAQDEEFAKPIFADFSKATGIVVLPKFDTESTKTAGLANEIVEEAQPAALRCLLEQRNPPHPATGPAGAVGCLSPEKRRGYPGCIARKTASGTAWPPVRRILLVNTKRVPKGQWPQSITDLTDAKWKGRIGMAKPLFGTTATHAACLFANWGDEKARAFFDKLKANEVRILSGNKQVAQAVSSGEIDFGITDTDDAYEEIQAARPVEIIYPDQGEGQIGTLYIPNTLAVIKGSPHAAEARKLVDYILSPEVEARLAQGPSASCR